MARILKDLYEFEVLSDATSPFPTNLSLYGAYANAMALVINIVIWVYILLQIALA